MAAPLQRTRFTELPRPFICGSLREPTVADTVATIQNSVQHGATAFSLHLSRLEPQERTHENLSRIFACTDAPILSLNYRNDRPKSDEERVGEQLDAVRAGAAAVDIPGDTFDPHPADWFAAEAGRVFDGRPREVAADASARRRQQELIAEVHDLGAEVMLSAHVRMPLGAEVVLEAVEDFAARGADMAKVVTLCLSDEDVVEAVRTMLLLRERVALPYQFQCHGERGKLTRMLSPMLGSMLVFANDHYTTRSLSAQPLIESMRAVFENTRWVAPLRDPLLEFSGA